MEFKGSKVLIFPYYTSEVMVSCHAFREVLHASCYMASCSPPSDSPSKLDMPPDKTYDMCKALCKKVSESVLRCMNECFDAFEAKFQSPAASQVELQVCVAN